MKNNLLVISDRDGTLVEFVDYLGKENNWKDQTKLNMPVVKLLKYIKDNYQSKIFVITNQAGVARKYFDCKRVEEINKHIEKKLGIFGIKIHGWNYCPHVDKKYASSHQEIDFDKRFLKEQTSRKPSTNMISELLNNNSLIPSSFKKILVLGDYEVIKN